MEMTADTKSTITLLDRENCHLQNIIFQQSHRPPPPCAHIHCLVSINVQQASMNVNICNFFSHGGIQFHTCVSYALPCQMTICQTAPLLPSVTQQQNVMEYCQERSVSTAIPPTSTFDLVGQHNKAGGITFRALSRTEFLIGF